MAASDLIGVGDRLSCQSRIEHPFGSKKAEAPACGVWTADFHCACSSLGRRDQECRSPRKTRRFAIDHGDLTPRELAVKYTDEKRFPPRIRMQEKLTRRSGVQGWFGADGPDGYGPSRSPWDGDEWDWVSRCGNRALERAPRVGLSRRRNSPAPWRGAFDAPAPVARSRHAMSKMPAYHDPGDRAAIPDRPRADARPGTPVYRLNGAIPA